MGVTQSTWGPSSIVMSWLVAFWLLSFIMAQIHNVEVSGYPTDGQDHMCTDEGGLILCPGHLSPGYHLSTHSLAHGNGDLHTGHLTPESGHGIGPGRFRSMKKMKMAYCCRNGRCRWSCAPSCISPYQKTRPPHGIFQYCQPWANL